MTEDAAVFGGLNNMIDGLANAYSLYKPKMIAVSTTCMAEVIGDDLNAFIKNAKEKGAGPTDGDGTDVLDEEPPPAGHPLVGLPNCVITPHVGSRTHESVQRQATAAVKNLILAMNGEKPLAQVNPEVPVKKVVSTRTSSSRRSG